jgi:isocitrate dehydrogenase (NAD+)
MSDATSSIQKQQGRYQIVAIEGDGIGSEVIQASMQLVEAAGVPVEWLVCYAGESALAKKGLLLPEETLDAIRRYKIALKGPTTTPIGKGHVSINVQLRQQLDLFAAVRPVRSIEGIKTRYDNVELVIIRENTEGLYSGIEHEVVPGVIEALKIVTEKASMRIAEYAFRYARERGRRKVTIFHKANIMKKTDGLFLKCARRVWESGYRDIQYNEMIVDNGCMQIVRDPSQFDVLLLDNLFGDIISDLCAGLVGGLGVVPGANIGDECAVFESVHGSAPDIAGKGLANPLAAIMSAVMMLNYIGESDAAERIKRAYNRVLAENDPPSRTRDIGGTGGTRSFADAIIARL